VRAGRHLDPSIWIPLTVYVCARAVLVLAALLLQLARARRSTTAESELLPALRYLARISIAGAPAFALAVGALAASRPPVPFTAPVAMCSLLLVAGLACLALTPRAATPPGRRGSPAAPAARTPAR